MIIYCQEEVKQSIVLLLCDANKSKNPDLQCAIACMPFNFDDI